MGQGWSLRQAGAIARNESGIACPQESRKHHPANALVDEVLGVGATDSWHNRNTDETSVWSQSYVSRVLPWPRPKSCAPRSVL